MSRPPKELEQDRFQIAISKQLSAYLADLLKSGLRGNSRQEVVRHLLGRAVDEEIRQGTMKRRP